MVIFDVTDPSASWPMVTSLSDHSRQSQPMVLFPTLYQSQAPLVPRGCVLLRHHLHQGHGHAGPLGYDVQGLLVLYPDRTRSRSS